MDWARDLPTWSLPELSRRVTLGRHRWHVQDTGAGELLLLLHGAGASTHTWRDLIPALAARHRVIALDLPGQGFSTGPYARMGLPEMAADLARLLDQEGWTPRAIVGHSAGAAVALELARHRDVPKIVGINPALANFEGMAEWLFPAMAKLLALNPLTASIFTLSVNPARAAKLIRGTGSEISDAGLAYYTRLMQDRAHVNGALTMMAHWALKDLNAALPDIRSEVLFLAGGKDQAVPPSVARDSAARLPNATCTVLDSLGHLLHEEDPGRTAALILDFIG